MTDRQARCMHACGRRWPLPSTAHRMEVSDTESDNRIGSRAKRQPAQASFAAQASPSFAQAERSQEGKARKG